MDKPTTQPAANDETNAQEGIGDLIRKHPAAFLAGGIVLGVIAGSLIPRGTSRRLAQGAVALAATAGEAGLVLSRNARDKAEDLGREGREALERNATVAQRRATELADNARATGAKLVDQVVELASKVRS